MIKNETNLQCRGWMLTIPAEKISLPELEKVMKKFNWIGQLELSESGYLHYQIYLETKNRAGVRFSTLKNKLPSFFHIEERRGTRQQAMLYVTKEATKHGEILGNLTPAEIKDEKGKRTDLEEYCSLIESGVSVNEIIFNDRKALRLIRFLEEYEKRFTEKEMQNSGIKRDLKVFFIHGKTRTGKTYGVLSSFNPGEIYRVTNYGTGAYDSYRGQKVLVYDEFSGQIPIAEVLTLTDGYFVELPCRYSNKIAQFDTVIFLSNLPPEQLYENAPKAQKDAFLARFNGGIYEQVNRGKFIDKNGVTNLAPYLT